MEIIKNRIVPIQNKSFVVLENKELSKKYLIRKTIEKINSITTKVNIDFKSLIRILFILITII